MFLVQKYIQLRGSVHEKLFLASAEVQSLIDEMFWFSSHFLNAGNKVQSLLCNAFLYEILTF